MKQLDDIRLHKALVLVCKLRDLPVSSWEASLRDFRASGEDPDILCYVEAHLRSRLCLEGNNKAGAPSEFKDATFLQSSAEEIVAGLAEVKEKSGPELAEVIQQIEQGLQQR
jgi:hypothetical protein